MNMLKCILLDKHYYVLLVKGQIIPAHVLAHISLSTRNKALNLICNTMVCSKLIPKNSWYAPQVEWESKNIPTKNKPLQESAGESALIKNFWMNPSNMNF